MSTLNSMKNQNHPATFAVRHLNPSVKSSFTMDSQLPFSSAAETPTKPHPTCARRPQHLSPESEEHAHSSPDPNLRHHHNRHRRSSSVTERFLKQDLDIPYAELSGEEEEAEEHDVGFNSDEDVSFSSLSEPGTARPSPTRRRGSSFWVPSKNTSLVGEEVEEAVVSSPLKPQVDGVAEQEEEEEEEKELPPIITHFEPPAAPHEHNHASATRHFLRASLGGDIGIAVTFTVIAMVPVVGVFTAEYISTIQLFALLWLLVLGKYVCSNITFWYHHMRPNATELRSSSLVGKSEKSFLRRRVEIRPHGQREGKSVWVPRISDDESKQRGFALFGMSLLGYFHDLFSWALEYKINAFSRVIFCDLGVGIYNTTTASQEDVYFLIMNSSLACFIDVEDGGKIKMFETRLPLTDGSTKHFYSVVSELDHVHRRHVRTWIQWEKALEGTRPEVTTFTDATEAINLYSLIGGLKSHVHVHWWCNAAQDLTHVWPLAQLSSSLTQGFNSAAQFSTGPVFSRDAEGMRDILANNALKEGIPIHSDLGSMAKNSLLHEMSSSCRNALKEVAPHLSMLDIEAIIQSTVMHAGDHFYPASVLPWKCYSYLLDAELTPYRATLTEGCAYRTRKLLCHQYKDEDPICAAIYACCHELDPYFADNYLTVGIAA